MKLHEIVLEDGSRIIRKSAQDEKELAFLSQSRKKIKATGAELWAYEIIAKNFKPSEYTREWIHKYRQFDFFFHSKKIALEIDGEYHGDHKQRMIDEAIDKKLLSEDRILVLRVKNFDSVGLFHKLNLIKTDLNEQAKVSSQLKGTRKTNYKSNRLLNSSGPSKSYAKETIEEYMEKREQILSSYINVSESFLNEMRNVPIVRVRRK